MKQTYNWAWVETQGANNSDVWNSSASQVAHHGPRYSCKEQQKREEAYDKALQAVEREIKSAPGTRAERIKTQDRIVAAFARFCASALDLQAETVGLLTNDFLPVGMNLARWARRFDADLSMADIIQACRNAWTACGLQPLLGVPVGITPSILGYSLLYPYSDNYLDQEEISADAKRHFSERFRCLLRGEDVPPVNRPRGGVAGAHWVDRRAISASLLPGRISLLIGDSSGAGAEYSATDK